MSTSIYGVSSTSTRITGMMSGLDTDSFVKGMTGSLLSRISSIKQQQQLLQWKAQSYQNVTKQLTTFNDTYMSYASNLNALSSSFYTSRSVTASSEFVSVSGYSSTANNLTIKSIDSYANNASLTTSKAASTTTIKLDGFSFDDYDVSNVAGQSLTFVYGDELVSIMLDPNRPYLDGDDVINEINTQLAACALSDGTFLGDHIQFTNSGVPGGTVTIGHKPGATEDLMILDATGKLEDILGLDLENDNKIEVGDPAITGVFDDSKLFDTVTWDNSVAGKKMTVSYNGSTATITMPEYDPTSATAQNDFNTALQAEFNRAFGVNRIKVSANTTTGEISMYATKSDGITADTTALLSITAVDGEIQSNSNVTVGLSNRLVPGRSIENQNFATTPTEGVLSDGTAGYAFEINGVKFEFTKEHTLTQIMDAVNKSGAGVKMEYMATTNTFSLTSTVDGAGGQVVINDLVGGGDLIESMFGVSSTHNIKAGKDAQITVNYGGQDVVITRGTNVFDIDGLVLTLDTNKTWMASDGVISFKSENNVDDVYDRVVALVEMFNEINALVNGELGTKYDREYPPLTDEQRKDMTESEIKTWEEKAKAGLLFNDPTMRALSQELRFVFSFDVPGAGFISEIGLKTSKEIKDYGKIIIDEDVLRKALEEDPDKVAALFTTPKADGADNGTKEQGIIPRMKDVFDKYASVTASTKGKLVTIAGVEGGSALITEDKIQINKQIDSLQKQLDQLNRSMEKQQDGYYKQFTALEVYIAKISAQSSWLYEQYS